MEYIQNTEIYQNHSNILCLFSYILIIFEKFNSTFKHGI